MNFIRKIAKGAATLWLIGVVLLGIGGTWLTHNPGALFGVDEADVEEMEAAHDRKQALREAKREAREFEDDGWGNEAVPYQRSDDGWGR